MKTLLVSLLFLCSLGLFAQDQYEIKTVWKDPKAAEGKTYMAIASMKKDRWWSSDIILIFGKKAGKLKVRSFTLGGSTFRTIEEAKTVSSDDFYKLKTVITDGKVLANLSPKGKWGNNYKMKYTLRESASSKRFANYALKVSMAQREQLRNTREFTSLKQFKRRLDLINWDFNYDSELDNDFPFPVFPLQIEWDFSSTLANKKIAASNINANANDLISKMFLEENSKWAGEDVDVMYLAEEEIERIYDSGSYQDTGYFTTFSKKTTGFEDKVLNKAAKKFVKYEIRSATGWECEDGIYTWESISWVLIDGSIYTYNPGTECD